MDDCSSGRLLALGPCRWSPRRPTALRKTAGGPRPVGARGSGQAGGCRVHRLLQRHRAAFLTRGRRAGGLALNARCSYLEPVVRRRHTSQPIPPITTTPATTMPATAPAGRPPPAAAGVRVAAWPDGTGLGVGAGGVADARADSAKATT